MPDHDDAPDTADRVDTLEAAILTVLARLAALETAVFGSTKFPMSHAEVAEAIAADAARDGRPVVAVDRPEWDRDQTGHLRIVPEGYFSRDRENLDPDPRD